MSQLSTLQQRTELLVAENAQLKHQANKAQENIYFLRSIFASYKRHAENVISVQEYNLKTARAQLLREYEYQENRNEQYLTLVETAAQINDRYNNLARIHRKRQRLQRRKINSLKSQLQNLTTDYENLSAEFRDYRNEMEEIAHCLEERET